MPDREFPIKNPRQLKDWIKNTASESNLAANTVLQNYMMERFLERVSLSQYRDNIILKGGFLIAAMIGIDLRSTLDMDTTIKGMQLSEEKITKIITEILSIPVDDNVTFEIKSIKPIHTEGEYEDFRVSILSHFFTMKVNMKIDITTGDIIIPQEVEYSFRLMFEDREIRIKAYNLNTILAEKIESILARNVSNTRARDYYDVYILMKTRLHDIQKEELHHAIIEKAKERNTLVYIERSAKYLQNIKESPDLQAIWKSYTQKYAYASDISYPELVDALEYCLDGIAII